MADRDVGKDGHASAGSVDQVCRHIMPRRAELGRASHEWGPQPPISSCMLVTNALSMDSRAESPVALVDHAASAQLQVRTLTSSILAGPMMLSFSRPTVPRRAGRDRPRAQAISPPPTISTRSQSWHLTEPTWRQAGSGTAAAHRLEFGRNVERHRISV